MRIKNSTRALFVLTFLLIFSVCGGKAKADNENHQEQGGDTMTFTLNSPAFTNNGSIPLKFSCDGEDISPELIWSDLPQGTETIALISDDPDAPAGTWVHWVIYNIPAEAGGLSEAVSTNSELADGSLQGRNSWGRLGYGGPCPPRGTHRYFFKAYALDTALEVSYGLSKDELLNKMEGHILAEAELMGTYSR